MLGMVFTTEQTINRATRTTIIINVTIFYMMSPVKMVTSVWDLHGVK